MTSEEVKKTYPIDLNIALNYIYFWSVCVRTRRSEDTEGSQFSPSRLWVLGWLRLGRGCLSLLNQHTACVWLILKTKSHCITQTGFELMNPCLSLLNAGFQDANNPHRERLLPFALPLCLLDKSLTAQSCGLLLTKLDWERAGWWRNCHSPEEKRKSDLQTLRACFGLPVPVRQHRKHVLPWASVDLGTQTLCWGIWESTAPRASSWGDLSPPHRPSNSNPRGVFLQKH